ncbi:hypothetical protein D3C74_375880 [compost metagenome]
MGDEHVGQTILLLQILHQIEHLCLNRYIQRGDRLIADDELWIQRQRAGNADPLPLAA